MKKEIPEAHYFLKKKKKKKKEEQEKEREDGRKEIGEQGSEVYKRAPFLIYFILFYFFYFEHLVIV